MHGSLYILHVTSSLKNQIDGVYIVYALKLLSSCIIHTIVIRIFFPFFPVPSVWSRILPRRYHQPLCARKSAGRMLPHTGSASFFGCASIEVSIYELLASRPIGTIVFVLHQRDSLIMQLIDLLVLIQAHIYSVYIVVYLCRLHRSTDVVHLIEYCSVCYT